MRNWIHTRLQIKAKILLSRWTPTRMSGEQKICTESMSELRWKQSNARFCFGVRMHFWRHVNSNTTTELQKWGGPKRSNCHEAPQPTSIHQPFSNKKLNLSQSAHSFNAERWWPVQVIMWQWSRSRVEQTFRQLRTWSELKVTPVTSVTASNRHRHAYTCKQTP